ncbi:MAG: thioredoxin family protein [Deltaproteobacteria bacterium]
MTIVLGRATHPKAAAFRKTYKLRLQATQRYNFCWRMRAGRGESAAQVARGASMRRLQAFKAFDLRPSRNAPLLGVLWCLIGLSACQQREVPGPPVPATSAPSAVSATSDDAEEKAISFTESLEDAFQQAGEKDRRVLVYFTGDHCGWCRRMEKETHADPQVVELASKFVCAKVNIGERPDLAEKYGVYGIPRTMIMTADGQPIDGRRGYEPPEEHRTWLEGALSKAPTTWPDVYESLAKSGAATAQPTAPPPSEPRGFPAKDSDLVIWFIEQDPKVFEDARWASHDELLAYLISKGFRPRIEHLYRWEAAERWQDAEKAQRQPDVLVSRARGGLLSDLMHRHLVGDVISTRLREEDPLAVCDDFRSRWIWSVVDSPNAERTKAVVEHLFAPKEGVDLGPRGPLGDADRHAVGELATSMARAWCTGDLEWLRPQWDEKAPQRDADGDNEELKNRKNYVVDSAGVRLFANEHFAVALVETRAAGTFANHAGFISSTQRVGTPTLVMLRRPEAEWRVLAVGHFGYDLIVSDPAALFGFAKDGHADERGAAAVPVGEIIAPDDGAVFGYESFKFRWRLSETERDGVQSWCVDTRHDDGWPRVILHQLRPDPGDGEMDFQIRGPTTAEIWTISPNAGVAFSERRHWDCRPPEE